MTIPQSPDQGEMVALLPCPFCGGQARLAFPDKRATGFIYCLADCGAEVRCSHQSAAITTWNARLATQSPAAELERRLADHIRDFRWRAQQCRTNPDAFDSQAASVWDFAADALEGK